MKNKKGHEPAVNHVEETLYIMKVGNMKVQPDHQITKKINQKLTL